MDQTDRAETSIGKEEQKRRDEVEHFGQAPKVDRPGKRVRQKISEYTNGDSSLFGFHEPSEQRHQELLERAKREERRKMKWRREQSILRFDNDPVLGPSGVDNGSSGTEF